MNTKCQTFFRAYRSMIILSDVSIDILARNKLSLLTYAHTFFLFEIFVAFYGKYPFITAGFDLWLEIVMRYAMVRRYINLFQSLVVISTL